MAQFVAAIPIKFVAFSPQAAVFFIRADDFNEAVEAAEKRQSLGAQAD